MFPSDCAPSRRTFLFAGWLSPPQFPTLASRFRTEPRTIPGSHRRSQTGLLSANRHAGFGNGTFMRDQVLHSVKGMSQADLDFLLDNKANAIGALLLHLAAVEKFYQLNTLQAFQR